VRRSCTVCLMPESAPAKHLKYVSLIFLPMFFILLGTVAST